MAEAVGLIGVGLLGSAVAERLLAAGLPVLAFDIDASRLQLLVAAGGHAAGSSEQIAQQCPCVVLSLPDSRIVGTVVQSLSGHWRTGCLILDTTTGSPQDAQQLAADLAQRGVRYSEVTIAGSSEQVRRGEALAMVGCEAPHWPDVESMCRHFARQSIWIGPPGHAARMKLTVNLALGLHRAVLAEALAFASALGIDERRALEVLRASPAYSTVMDTKGEKMLTSDYSPQARLRQHLKDVQLMLEQADQQRIALPLSEVHRKLLEDAVARGFGELDNSAIRWMYRASE